MLEIYGIALLSNHHFPADGTAAEMHQKIEETKQELRHVTTSRYFKILEAYSSLVTSSICYAIAPQELYITTSYNFTAFKNYADFSSNNC